MLENLTREKQLLSKNVYARQEIITDSDQLQEIIEPYDEEEHESWKSEFYLLIFLFSRTNFILNLMQKYIDKK